MKAMEHNGYTAFSTKLGLIGGMAEYFFLQIATNTSFTTKLFQAGLTALLCGFLGIAGKEGYLYIKKVIKNKKT